jgi:hypothetical protein
MQNGASATADGSGDVRYLAKQNVTVGSINAGTGNADIISLLGGVLDNGDATSVVSAAGLRLEAATGIGQIGAGNGALEIDATTLSAKAGVDGINLDEQTNVTVTTVGPVFDLAGTVLPAGVLPVIIQSLGLTEAAVAHLAESQSDLETTGSVVLNVRGVGVAANATVSIPGDNNNLKFTATSAGTFYNDVTIQFVNGEVLNVGYANRALTVTVVPGVTKASDVVGFNFATAGVPFTAALATNETSGANTGAGLVHPGPGLTLSTGSDTVKANATITIPGGNNDLKFTATSFGTAYNDVVIKFVNGSVLGAVYDNNILTITVVPGATTAQDLVNYLASAGGPFTAELVNNDPSGTSNGLGFIHPGPATTGATGVDGVWANATMDIPGDDNNLKFTARTPGRFTTMSRSGLSMGQPVRL